MASRHAQQGWYNSVAVISLMAVAVLFVAQPWIPLALVATLVGWGMVVGANKGIAYLRHYYHDHHPHLH
ncbi:hypothetical protein HNQ59_001106 [Chitinivorax tropicus]|uniref:Uncharacterized protein n=1 Tax=Chitinivorax tropicus TaxID=714531 RepID=A0A840MMV4_9PROT|nr:hypothetical protein [Chitinivorax tropicus]MBB5017836.1 hypothetical protein [Chitinivorax tropicus]